MRMNKANGIDHGSDQIVLLVMNIELAQSTAIIEGKRTKN